MIRAHRFVTFRTMNWTWLWSIFSVVSIFSWCICLVCVSMNGFHMFIKSVFSKSNVPTVFYFTFKTFHALVTWWQSLMGSNKMCLIKFKFCKCLITWLTFQVFSCFFLTPGWLTLYQSNHFIETKDLTFKRKKPVQPPMCSIWANGGCGVFRNYPRNMGKPMTPNN